MEIIEENEENIIVRMTWKEYEKIFLAGAFSLVVT